MSTCRSACPYDCPEGCSLLVETEGNAVTSITGDPANPYTDGWVCAKLRNLPEAINSPHRILTPLRRTGAKGSGEFAPISWEEAIGEITSRWKDLMAQYGAETILPYSYAGTMGIVHRNCGEGFFHALGASRLKRTLCSSAKSAGWQKVMGDSCDLSPWDVEHSDLILLWSANIPATRAHLAPILRKAKENGAKIILIDVYENPSAELADQTILIQPGTDGALALSMLQVLDQEGLTDEAWLSQHAAGWDELRTTLEVWDPEETQCVVGLAPDVIRELARAYGKAKAPCIVLGSGFSRSGNGGEATRAIAALPAAVGAWAKRGGGTYGVCSSPALIDKSPVKRPDLADPHTQEVNINQLGPVLEGRGVKTPIHSLYVYHANPASVTSHQNAILRGLAREDLFTVVHERYMTDTALYADIILPAPYMVEQTDLYTPYGYRQIQYAPAAVPAPGQVKSNFEVFALLAAAMGMEDPFQGSTPEDLCRRMVEDSAVLTRAEKDKVLAGEPVVLDTPFPLPIETEDGRVHLDEPIITWFPPYGGGEPFHLVCAPAVHTLNSSFNECGALQDLRGEMTARMNREDAARLGLAQGDKAVFYNDLGEMTCTVALDRAVAPMTVVAEGVYPGKNTVNCLTHPRLSDRGDATTMNDNTVWVRKA
ncbi:molybdopterin-containing oxidoreductase family protein [Flavonifractor plautii]|uniref:molybdopterin-containing oxidoreductase family protein n=2 Tax=Flavonifractor TaxID=946234 RepID=UPI00195BA0F4|nr:molybdopterin-dependent oxidoreductase [Flavonifractor plautii]MBM6665555.1 molybdopterin-dependent oxidoreductase [Flavonifractor plautii]